MEVGKKHAPGRGDPKQPFASHPASQEQTEEPPERRARATA